MWEKAEVGTVDCEQALLVVISSRDPSNIRRA